MNINSYFHTLSWGLCLMCLFPFLNACKTTKNTTGSQLSNKLKIEQIDDFAYISTKSKISFKDHTQDLKSAADIRFQKDKAIWMSIRPALGIEAARILITADSAFAVDRINKRFFAYNYKSFAQQMNIDVDFKHLQALLLGNLLPLKNTKESITEEQEWFILKQITEAFIVENHISRKNDKLTKVLVSSPQTQTKLSFQYTNFESVNKFLVPKTLHAVLDYEKDGNKETKNVDIEHSKITFQKEVLDMPFSIPTNYTDGTKKE